jgi:predicted phage terminase large subunit-like protein
MTSPQFAKVFPYYAQFKCDTTLMFQFHSRKDLKFAITGSKKSTNFRIVTKLSDVNGVRAKYLFLDDITQRKDMSNLNQHQKDIHTFTHEWFERNYNRNFFYIIASGTTYSQFDLLSHLRRVMGGDEAAKSPINKYTLVGKSNYIVPNGVSVFVSVPLLDYDTDESTYPKKISTVSARKKREENPTEFWAMDQQRPLPPDSSPFYFTKLRQYTTLPPIGEKGRLETCVAALDTKRRGKDFLSMPIFFEADDPERSNESAFLLKDWLYDDRTMKECLPLIVAKIIQHKITRLYVERNTEECIETLLQDKLKEQGYTSCVIEEVYSTEPKDRRIMTAEGDIKAKMIFPEYNMYAPSNDIGKALLNVYGYRYDGKVAHDDAPDSLALFAKRFLMNMGVRLAEISIFTR